MIDSWIDIPNLQTVDLPKSFIKVKSKSITSMLVIINEWIDISPILDDMVQISDSTNNMCSTAATGNYYCATVTSNYNCTTFL